MTRSGLPSNPWMCGIGDVEGDRNGSVIIRGSYVPAFTADGVFLDILWDEEFQDTDTPTPDAIIVCIFFPSRNDVNGRNSL